MFNSKNDTVNLLTKKENAEEICLKIHDEAILQAQDIVERAKKESEKIIENGNKDAAQKEAEIALSLQKDLEKIKEQVFSTVHIETKRASMDEKVKLIENILSEVKKLSARFRQSEDYRNFLIKAIIESINVISCDKVDIFYSIEDNSIIKDIAEKETKDIRINDSSVQINYVKSTFNDIGVFAQSVDGRLIYDNRFSARFKRAYEDIYTKLLREAF